MLTKSRNVIRLLLVSIFLPGAFLALVTSKSGHADDAKVDSDASAQATEKVIDSFVLNDFRGKQHALSDFSEAELVVVYFMGTECPLAKLYGPRMQRLADQYAARGVAFVGVGANVQDSIAELAAHARDHGITFPLLKDLSNQVADKFGATRTPEVFVLDRERKIRYQGRIDGQFTFGSGVGLSQPVAKRNDLAEAIDELLAGKQVSVPVTEARGCLIGRARKANLDSAVTYSNQIARLFQARCVECHRAGQIAPFALTDYDEAAGWGDMIAEVVREQRMPPWHANPSFGHFSNENRLTDEEKQLVYTWVENGCPEGDPQALPQPKKYAEGWFMRQEPDQIIYMTDEPVDVKAEGVEDYRYYVVDPGFEQDRWVSMAECMPGNRSIVHHIIVYIQSPESKSSNIGKHELLVGFAPGTRPVTLPAGWARRIPAGAKLIFEMHYTPIGTPQKDRSSLGLVFMDEKDVTHHSWTTNAINTRLEIPAHAGNHQEQARKEFKEDVQLLSMFPHMHMRGKSFRYELTYPDGTQEVLLDVPRYDFNWQSSFILAEPKLIPKGTKMLCTAHFDNSENNLANPDPTQTVRWGEQTWEEMLIGWHDVATPRDKHP
jgi:peroxiredoxin/mono/diheme cytochrome c family protein